MRKNIKVLERLANLMDEEKIMEKIKAEAEVYAVATTQEEVGLKGARISAFRINPDFAIAVDTTIAGDIPQIKESESSLKLGDGVAITIIEASGRGIIVNEKGLTSLPGVYAGGDIVTGAATVITAMGAGKLAAASIYEHLGNKTPH